MKSSKNTFTTGDHKIIIWYSTAYVGFIATLSNTMIGTVISIETNQTLTFLFVSNGIKHLQDGGHIPLEP